MPILKINDLKIQLPKKFKNIDIEEYQFIEWIEREIGKKSYVENTNPLLRLLLKDCIVKIGNAMIDEKNIINNFKTK